VVHSMDSLTDYRRLAEHRGGLYFVTPSREHVRIGRGGGAPLQRAPSWEHVGVGGRGRGVWGWSSWQASALRFWRAHEWRRAHEGA
jgi:hypothetical protein